MQRKVQPHRTRQLLLMMITRVSFTEAAQESQNEVDGGILSVFAELSAVSGKDVVIPISENTSSTAPGNGTNFLLSANSLSIPARQTAEGYTITIVRDNLDESDETVINNSGWRWFYR